MTRSRSAILCNSLEPREALELFAVELQKYGQPTGHQAPHCTHTSTRKPDGNYAIMTIPTSVLARLPGEVLSAAGLDITKKQDRKVCTPPLGSLLQALRR